MTFNVPAGTEAGVAVIREDATPGEVAQAAQDMLDQALGAVMTALAEEDLPEDVCSLDATGNEVVLVIQDPEPNRAGYYRALVERHAEVLARLGIGAVSVQADLMFAIVAPGEAEAR